MNKIPVTVNTLFLGLSPALAFAGIYLYPVEFGDRIPDFGVGLSLSSLFTVLLWSVALVLARHRYEKSEGASFTLFNLILPAVLTAVNFTDGDSLYFQYLEIAAYHFMTIGIAVLFFTALTPVFSVKTGKNPFTMKLEYKPAGRQTFIIAWVIGIPFLTGLVSLPAIAVETALLSLWDVNISQIFTLNFWQINYELPFRYAGIMLNASVLFRIFFYETDLTHRSGLIIS